MYSESFVNQRAWLWNSQYIIRQCMGSDCSFLSFNNNCWITFICFISSNICSGGREATACEIASGALSGGQGAPYGETSGTTLPVGPRLFSSSLLSDVAVSTLSDLPLSSYPENNGVLDDIHIHSTVTVALHHDSVPDKFLIADLAVSWSWYSQKP